MLSRRLSKAHISISTIGAMRFWSGTLIGLLASLSLGFFFSHSREALRFSTEHTTDLLILSSWDHWFWNYFFAGLSVTMGLSISIWRWLGSRRHHRIRDRRYKQFGRTMVMMTFWFVIMAIARVGSLLPIMPQGLRGYDNDLDLSGDFGLMFIAIPIFLFLVNWSSVRLVYQSTLWMAYSVIICTSLTFGLAHLVSIPQELHNHVSFQRFIEHHEFIDQEVNRAKNQYGIEYSEETITSLKKRYSRGSVLQLEKLKHAFESERPTSLDTILLERMAIHTMKGIEWYMTRQTKLEDWQFASPENVFNQISKFKPSDKEAMELTLILQEQIRLWNFESDEIDYDWHLGESKWFHHARSRVPLAAVEQLRGIRGSMLSDSGYVQLRGLLPEIFERRQKVTL